MNKNISETIENTIFTTIALIVFLIATSVICLSLNGNATPIKDGVSLIGDYVGGITTLSAAYIAYIIYSGWRAVEEFKTIQLLHDESVDVLKECMKELNRIKGKLTIIQVEKLMGGLTDEVEYNKFIDDLRITTTSVLIQVQELTFSMCVKIAMAYTSPLNKDPDLQYMFKTLNEIKAFIDEIINGGVVDDEIYQRVLKYIEKLALKLDDKASKKNATQSNN